MSWLRKLQRGCNLQHTPKPLCDSYAVCVDPRSVFYHYGESCKQVVIAVTHQPQSTSSGFQGLEGRARIKHFAKCINFALLAAMQNVIHLLCLLLSPKRLVYEARGDKSEKGLTLTNI